MIFVTVGAQMPFDRLIRAIDQWADGSEDVLAQIGSSDLRPSRIRWTAFLEPNEFNEAVRAADVIVSHAGMGSIITALQYGKPILIMPRRGDLRETRNDHQIATAEHFRTIEGVSVALDETELHARLAALKSSSKPEMVGQFASENLLSAVRAFIHHAEHQAR